MERHRVERFSVAKGKPVGQLLKLTHCESKLLNGDGMLPVSNPLASMSRHGVVGVGVGVGLVQSAGLLVVGSVATKLKKVFAATIFDRANVSVGRGHGGVRHGAPARLPLPVKVTSPPVMSAVGSEQLAPGPTVPVKDAVLLTS